MDIQVIGKGRLVIFIDGDELGALPDSPRNITPDQAADILRRALGAAYDKSWECVCFEMFHGRDSLLLFALKHAGSPYFFAFDSIEPLISAAADCPPGVIAYLTYVGDHYCLVVYPWNGEAPPPVLYEYGEELARPAPFALHLSEHSAVIAGPFALDELNSAFNRK